MSQGYARLANKNNNNKPQVHTLSFNWAHTNFPLHPTVLRSCSGNVESVCVRKGKKRDLSRLVFYL